MKFQVQTDTQVRQKNSKWKSNSKKWYFVTKIVLTYCEKKMLSYPKKLFAKFLRLLEQFIQTVNDHNNFW
jgi:hypothetical protein